MGLVGLVEFQMIISNESMDFNDPKEFDDPQVFDDPKGTSIGSMDCHNPKVYSDTCFTINYRPFHIQF